MISTRTLKGALLVLTAVTMASCAGTPPAPGAEAVAPDTSGDGMVDRAEARAHFDRVFAAIDRNNDGALSRDEYLDSALDPVCRSERPVCGEQRRKRIKELRFSDMDRNGDGVIGRDEFVAYTDRIYRAADLDGKGQVSTTEFGYRRSI